MRICSALTIRYLWHIFFVPYLYLVFCNILIINTLSRIRVNASGNDGLEIAVTNYNHLEQSICITATFIF